MSVPVTISVEGIPGCGKSTLLKSVRDIENFTVIDDSVGEMFDSITSKGVKNLMDPWAFFMQKPSVRGLRFMQTLMIRKAEEMAKTIETKFKVVERSIQTTRFVVAKFAEGLGVDDLDVSATKELYHLLVQEPRLTPDLFVVISDLETDYMCKRFERNKARFGEWMKGREVQHEWNRLTRKFASQPEFQEKVVFINGQTTKEGVAKRFLDVIRERFPDYADPKVQKDQ